MTREKDFEKAAMDYCEDHSHCIYFEAGAEHGYQYAIDKACEWLKQHSFDYLMRDMYDNWTYDDETMIRDFRKCMEE